MRKPTTAAPQNLFREELASPRAWRLTKEELFQAAVRHALASALQATNDALADPSLTLELKLVGAFDAWIGKYVGSFGAGAADLAEASATLLGPIFPEHDALFIEALMKTIRASGLVAAYKAIGVNARQLSETLYATARGLKYSCTSRQEFIQRMTVAVRAMCMPLAEET